MRIAVLSLLCCMPLMSQEPSTTRPQALLGLVGDVAADGSGFQVSEVIPGSPATNLARADAPVVVSFLRKGDVVLRVDGRRFRTWRQWYDRLNAGVLANDGIVRITVRNTKGGEFVWLVRPTIAEVDVSSDPAPLIVVPAIRQLPTGELANVPPSKELRAREKLTEIEKKLGELDAPKATYREIAEKAQQLRLMVAEAQKDAQLELDERAKAIEEAFVAAQAKREERQVLPELRARVDDLELKAFGMDDALRAIEERVMRSMTPVEKVGRAELAGTWKGELIQGKNKIAITVTLDANGSAKNEAGNGLSGKGTWTREGDQVLLVWSTREMARWQIVDGKLVSRGQTPRGEMWELQLSRESTPAKK